MKSATNVAIALVAGAIALSVGASLRSTGGYRAPAAPIIEASDGDFERPVLPLNVATATIGRRLAADDPDPFHAAALGGALAMALAVAVTVLTAAVIAGRFAALLTTAAILLTPATPYHAFTAGPEAAMVLASSLLVLAMAIRAPIPRAAVGLLALAACAAGHHAGLLAFLPWLAAAHFMSPKTEGPAERRCEIRLGRADFGWWLPLVAPIAVLMLWPHLDTDAGKRLAAIVVDPVRSPHPPWLVFGTAWDQTLSYAPNTLAGLMLTLIRPPPAITLTSIVGLGALTAYYKHHGILTLTVTLLLVFGLNGSPYYAGHDGFAALIPPLSIASGVGAGVLAERAVGRIPIPRTAGLALVGFITLGPAGIDTMKYWSNAPAHRVAPFGGAAGVESRTDAEIPMALVDWMNAELPKGARVCFVPEEAGLRPLLDTLRERGILRRDIRTSAPYDATHAIRFRMPGHPLYSESGAWLSTPAIALEQVALYAL